MCVFFLKLIFFDNEEINNVCNRIKCFLCYWLEKLKVGFYNIFYIILIIYSKIINFIIVVLDL